MKKIAAFIIALGVAPGFGQSLSPDFALNDVAGGTTLSLGAYARSNPVALIFTSNVCPFDGYYRERIRNLVSTYKGRVSFLLVNSCLEAVESADNMKSAYAMWGLDIPYLADKNQDAMNALFAKKSPEVFLLKQQDGKFTTVYNGAIDDNPQDSKAVSESYLKMAIDDILGGRKVGLPMGRSGGCSIKRK